MYRVTSTLTIDKACKKTKKNKFARLEEQGGE